jgi:hypothetical protein
MCPRSQCQCLASCHTAIDSPAGNKSASVAACSTVFTPDCIINSQGFYRRAAPRVLCWSAKADSRTIDGRRLKKQLSAIPRRDPAQDSISFLTLPGTFRFPRSVRGSRCCQGLSSCDFSVVFGLDDQSGRRIEFRPIPSLLRLVAQSLQSFNVGHGSKCSPRT